MSRQVLSTYVPDRPPTWFEVGLAVLMLGLVGSSFRVGKPVWPAFMGGFVLFALAVGPVANTSFGCRVGDWFRGIGVSGRAAVIMFFIGLVAVVARMLPDLMELVGDVGYGGLAAMILHTTLHLLVAGEVSGWRPDVDSTK